MTSVFRARQRAEELDALLGGRMSPEHAHRETRELAGVAGVLTSQAPVAPRPAFAAELRERLMAEAAEVLTPANRALTLPARPRGKRERRLVAVASALVLVGGTASMAVAAEHALPGEALYPIKRGIEHAEAGLSTSSASKGRDLLSQADDRLSEARGLLGQDRVGTDVTVPRTIADFTGQAREGSALMMKAFRVDQDPATIVAVRAFAARGVTDLQELAKSAPPEAQDELAAAATALSEIDAEARGLCDTCARDLPDLDVPPMFLTSADVGRALRRAEHHSLHNDHPVVVDKGTLGGLLGQLQLPEASTSPKPHKKSGPSASPSPSQGPTSLLPPLPGVGSTTSNDDPATDVGKTVKKVTKQLTDPIATLLP